MNHSITRTLFPDLGRVTSFGRQHLVNAFGVFGEVIAVILSAAAFSGEATASFLLILLRLNHFLTYLESLVPLRQQIHIGNHNLHEDLDHTHDDRDL
jgi:hypothetical protein